MAYDASREERFTREGPPASGAPDRRHGRPTGETGHGWYWLFLIPFVAVLLPWIYNTRDPELFGIPFFYWYQMAWVPLTVIITIAVYIRTKGRA